MNTFLFLKLAIMACTHANAYNYDKPACISKIVMCAEKHIWFNDYKPTVRDCFKVLK